MKILTVHETVFKLPDNFKGKVSDDNEGTESPYWLIIDPSAVKNRLVFDTEEDPEGHYTADLNEDETVQRVLDMVPHCITGPFFSREDAETHMSARHYAFSKDAYVYCHSGYWSRKYKEANRNPISIEIGEAEMTIKADPKLPPDVVVNENGKVIAKIINVQSEENK